MAGRADLTGVEHFHQVALFEWAAIHQRQYPELEFLFAVPNGGKRDIRTARRLKAEGVRPGVPDVWFPVPRGGYLGLVIEMKSPENLTGTTPLQKRWLAFLQWQGYLAQVCNNVDAAIFLLHTYLENGWKRGTSSDPGGATALSWSSLPARPSPKTSAR